MGWLDKIKKGIGEFIGIREKKPASLEELFSDSYISTVSDVVFESLFEEKNRYSDSGMFSKVRASLKSYIENLGLQWNEEKVRELFQKSKIQKNLASELEDNYNYYVNDVKLEINFNNFQEYLNSLIDRSIKDGKFLTKQYARMVTQFYYYKKYSKVGTIDALYKNLIVMISREEFRLFIIDDSKCFERIISRVKKRLTKIGVENIDDRELIVQIIKSSHFSKALKESSFIDHNARESSFAPLYISVIDNNINKPIDLNVKNIVDKEKTKDETVNKSNETVEQSIKSNSIEKPKPKENQEKEVVKNDSTVTKSKDDLKTNESQKIKNEQKEVSEAKAESKKDLNEAEAVDKNNSEPRAKPGRKKEDDLDKFLKKIGGNRDVNDNDTVKFLESIEDNLKDIEINDTTNYSSIDIYSDNNYDEDIELLIY